MFPNKLDPGVRRAIVSWALEHLFAEDLARREDRELAIDLASGYCQNEAFVYFAGRDYYVLGKRYRKKVHLHIRLLESVNDLPAIPETEVPGPVLKRLKRK